MKTLLQTLITIMITGCGIQIENADDLLQQQQEESANEEESNTDNTMIDNEGSLFLKGSISSSFAISVNGEHYDDSEDFYTQQVDILESEKADNGYADYELTFDAKLGLNDLKYGMTVYAQSAGDTGYAGESRVDNDGKFEMEFPANANDELLNIRANKRIGIILKGPNGELIQWCYNFSATTETYLGYDNKPLILRHFNTKLTKYKCSVRKGSNSLAIPNNTSSNTYKVDDGKAPTQDQLDEWDQQWEDEVVNVNNEDDG